MSSRVVGVAQEAYKERDSTVAQRSRLFFRDPYSQNERELSRTDDSLIKAIIQSAVQTFCVFVIYWY